jgi:hypothetical protein
VGKYPDPREKGKYLCDTHRNTVNKMLLNEKRRREEDEQSNSDNSRRNSPKRAKLDGSKTEEVALVVFALTRSQFLTAETQEIPQLPITGQVIAAARISSRPFLKKPRLVEAIVQLSRVSGVNTTKAPGPLVDTTKTLLEKLQENYGRLKEGTPAQRFRAYAEYIEAAKEVRGVLRELNQMNGFESLATVRELETEWTKMNQAIPTSTGESYEGYSKDFDQDYIAYGHAMEQVNQSIADLVAAMKTEEELRERMASNFSRLISCAKYQETRMGATRENEEVAIAARTESAKALAQRRNMLVLMAGYKSLLHDSAYYAAVASLYSTGTKDIATLTAAIPMRGPFKEAFDSTEGRGAAWRAMCSKFLSIILHDHLKQDLPKDEFGKIDTVQLFKMSESCSADTVKMRESTLDMGATFGDLTSVCLDLDWNASYMSPLLGGHIVKFPTFDVTDRWKIVEEFPDKYICKTSLLDAEYCLIAAHVLSEHEIPAIIQPSFVEVRRTGGPDEFGYIAYDKKTLEECEPLFYHINKRGSMIASVPVSLNTALKIFEQVIDIENALNKHGLYLDNLLEPVEGQKEPKLWEKNATLFIHLETGTIKLLVKEWSQVIKATQGRPEGSFPLKSTLFVLATALFNPEVNYYHHLATFSLVRERILEPVKGGVFDIAEYLKNPIRDAKQNHYIFWRERFTPHEFLNRKVVLKETFAPTPAANNAKEQFDKIERIKTTYDQKREMCSYIISIVLDRLVSCVMLE